MSDTPIFDELVAETGTRPGTAPDETPLDPDQIDIFDAIAEVDGRSDIEPDPPASAGGGQ